LIYPRITEEEGLDDFTRRDVRRAATQLMWIRNDFRAGLAGLTLGFCVVYFALMKVVPNYWFLVPLLVGQPVVILFVNHIFIGWYRQSFREALSRRTNALCAVCGYSFVTLPSDIKVCPECGSARDVLAAKYRGKKLPAFFRAMPRKGASAGLDDRVWLEVAGEAYRRLYRQPVVIGLVVVVCISWVVLPVLMYRSRLPEIYWSVVMVFLTVVLFLCILRLPWVFSKIWCRLVDQVIAERRGERCPRCRQDLRGLSVDQANCPECWLARGTLRDASSNP